MGDGFSHIDSYGDTLYVHEGNGVPFVLTLIGRGSGRAVELGYADARRVAEAIRRQSPEIRLPLGGLELVADAEPTRGGDTRAEIGLASYDIDTNTSAWISVVLEHERATELADFLTNQDDEPGESMSAAELLDILEPEAPTSDEQYNEGYADGFAAGVDEASSAGLVTLEPVPGFDPEADVIFTEESFPLDARRVAALEKATELAGARTAIGAYSITWPGNSDSALAYAAFLIGEPAAQPPAVA